MLPYYSLNEIWFILPKPIQHFVFSISVKPEVRPVPDNGIIVAETGDSVTLACEISRGSPTPEMTWTRKERKMPTGEDNIRGLSLTYTAVTRHHSGIYICSADNGFGQPTVANLKLDVQRKFYKIGKKYLKSRNEFTTRYLLLFPPLTFFMVYCVVYHFTSNFVTWGPQICRFVSHLPLVFMCLCCHWFLKEFFKEEKNCQRRNNSSVLDVFNNFSIFCFQNASNFVFCSNFCWIRRNFSFLYLSK